ncbi:gamma-glutamyltransferase family protein [Ornithinimicrobium faecis]|uniref:Gamma-glutamyltransferase family protein n=1 Tax=Ornithinimicrobium faecis TaxID=2934158 RepID=A0ABY4YSG4_9MICO|nr:gamma-glutamyltransferase family protein [Ornithinimicrobium sp. HY1793]USQ79534.1 gamma-glutamyltransferase family protein [Ornithinimicrobium sp. HY1793]
MADFTTRPTLTGTFGMVSSTHWIASQTAMGILEQGGNAFDAAVAGGFVLHLVEPHLNGPGGDLPAIIATADDPTPTVLCGQGPAPAGATVEHFRAQGMDRVPGSGPLATAVPGAVDAWLLLLRDHGSMPPAQVLAPACHYARHGHPLVARVGATVAAVQDLFESDWTTSADVWLSGGRPPRPGELFRNTAWADTLDRLVAAGEGAGNREAQVEAVRAAWSQGFVAEAVDAFARRAFRHSDGRVLPGVLTGQDLADYSATWEPALTREWQGHTIAKTGPWGQGPALLQVLGMLDALGDPPDPDTADGVHAVAEAWKLAMADREAWFGDSGDEPVPIDDLLDPDYLAQRASLIGADADRTVRPGSPGGRTPRMAAFAGLTEVAGGGPGVGEPTVTREQAQREDRGEPDVGPDGVTRGDTCHLDVVDRWGNMVSATPSGGWLQSSPVIPELGFPLGSRLQMMWLEQGLPSSLRPGRRPRTTLTPTLVLREGRPVLACGSPGGDQQDQWQSLFLLRHLAHGATLQEAIDAPAFHTTSFPGSFDPRITEPGVLVVEDRLPETVRSDLRSRGHDVLEQGPWSLGRMCAVARDPESGLLSAGANPRGMQGYAVGR